jgi:hypothetical protein
VSAYSKTNKDKQESEVRSFTTLGSAPAIDDAGLKDITIKNGDKLTLSVKVTGTPSPTIQWYHDDKEIAGETSATYTKAPAGTAEAGSYHVTATNGIKPDAKSKVVKVTFIELPTVTSPANVIVDVGSPASFTVDAKGSGTITYQWKDSKGNISGETGKTYKITTTLAAMDGNTYSCVVKNEAGEVPSDPATLTLKKYSVKYDANGGTGAPTDTKKYLKEAPVTISTVKPDNGSNYTFGGWNDGSKTYGGGVLYTMGTGDVTFKAVWETVPECTIIFNGNGADTEADPKTMTVKKNASVSSLPKQPNKVGHKFIKWIDKTGKEFNTTYQVTSDITVSASWEKEIYTVKFESANKEVTINNSNVTAKYVELIELKNPTGYDATKWIFTGWYDGIISCGSSITVMGNVTIYARFEKNSPPLVEGKNFKGPYGGTLKITADDISVMDETPQNKIKLKADFEDPKGDAWFDLTEEGNNILVTHDLTVTGAEYFTVVTIILYVLDEGGLESNKVTCSISFE